MPRVFVMRTLKRCFNQSAVCAQILGKNNPEIIVLSNRLPFVLEKKPDGSLMRRPSAGGLVTAVAPVIIQGGGMWVGWPGTFFKEGVVIPESHPNDKSPTARLKSDKIVPVVINEELSDLYYNGCCNYTFWPLFHSMPDRAKFSTDYWHGYEVANQIFSDKTIGALMNAQYFGKDKDVIVWVHDYHLMLCCEYIRKTARFKNLRIKLAFFLHIPFPSWDIFQLFPWGDAVLQGLLGSDLIGFHTEQYSKNFISCCNKILGCNVSYSKKLVEHNGRTIIVQTLPIGIPYKLFDNLSLNAKRVLDGQHRIILGVDRLDYTKGLPYRLKAFKLFLSKYPQYIEKVVFLQIAVPTRINVKEYQALKHEMDELVGDINGQFTTANWTPIRYISGMHSQEKLVSLYRDCDVAFIAPIRDGMNLVAKEFVACQQKSPGVLIISPFAGVAESMKEALIANPLEPEECAEALHRALTMSENEKMVRINHLKHREKEGSVDHWVRTFLETMKSVSMTTHGDASPQQPLTEEVLNHELKHGLKKLRPHVAILVDYDGTLAPIQLKPELAVLPKQTRELLERLSNMPNVTLGIISGRLVENVMEMVKIRNIIYSGSHGQKVYFPNGDRHEEPASDKFLTISKAIADEMMAKICIDGAWVEFKGIYLAFHYRPVPKEKHSKLSKEAIRIIKKHGFIPRKAHKAIESKPPVDWHKGTACLHILTKMFGFDWYNKVSIFFVGDDLTDEDAMLALKGMAYTYRVVKGEYIKTYAEKQLPSTESVLVLLNWIEKQYSERLNKKKN